ncbi:hypothetical protein QE357_003134 [Siphonobacter sp. BAB-5404]|nr:hypothetical protein [Siphonobacter sp. SORGH_AS_0500]
MSVIGQILFNYGHYLDLNYSKEETPKITLSASLNYRLSHLEELF